MFSKYDCEKILFLAAFVVAIGILKLCGYQGTNSFGDPLNKWIFLLIWIIYSIWSWKDKRELFKRYVLALPFSLLTVVLLSLTVLDLSSSSGMGVLMFILLTIGKENSKQYFVVRLVTGAILISLLAILITLIKNTMGMPLNESPKSMKIYTAFVVTGLVIAALVFYETYCTLSSRSEKVSKWRPVIVRSVMFAGAISLFFAVFIISDNLCERFNIGFWISFAISVLIALGFLGVCKLFNVKHPVSYHVSKTTINKINQADVCGCCGKTGIQQEFLFKIDSGQRLCADCLKKMNDI